MKHQVNFISQFPLCGCVVYMRAGCWQAWSATLQQNETWRPWLTFRSTNKREYLLSNAFSPEFRDSGFVLTFPAIRPLVLLWYAVQRLKATWSIGVPYGKGITEVQSCVSLKTGIRYEKCVVRRIRRCANVIECTYTNLDSTV